MSNNKKPPTPGPTPGGEAQINAQAFLAALYATNPQAAKNFNTAVNTARKKKMQEMQNSFGVLAETMLITYRAILGAGATKEEAFEILKAYIAGLTQASRKPPEESEADQ